MNEKIKQLLDELNFKETMPGTFTKKLSDDMVVGMRFNKNPKKGEPLAMKNGKLLDDITGIPELEEFVKRRDEILQSSAGVERQINNGSDKEQQGTDKVNSSLDMGQKEETFLNNHTPTPSPSGVKNSPAPTSNLYQFFLELVDEGGIIELFSDTGLLKSTACSKIAFDAIERGKTVFYIDTEGKVGLQNKRRLKALNCYNYIPDWKDITKSVESLGKYDVLIIDSLGFPISAKAAGMGLNEQGQAWNDMMSLVGDTCKSWAYKNNAIVIFTNQPKSEMMKSQEELKRLNAVGDKVHFAPNAILKAVDKVKVPGHYDTKLQKTILPETCVTLLSHRIPDFMDDTIMLKIYKRNDEVRIEIPENISQRLKELRE